MNVLVYVFRRQLTLRTLGGIVGVFFKYQNILTLHVPVYDVLKSVLSV